LWQSKRETVKAIFLCKIEIATKMVIRIVGPKEYKPNDIPVWSNDHIFVVNTTSRGKHKDLSPFYLGPVNLYRGYIAQNMENAWQYSKVYSNHVINNSISDAYFKWAEDGWAKKRGIRYPMGKGAKPEFSYWDDERLDYIQARKKIYIPLYASLVQQTNTFVRMKKYYNEDNSLILWDFDGYDYSTIGMSLIDVVNDPNRKMGHAFIIAMLLENKLSTILS
jgi:hypothetical protein